MAENNPGAAPAAPGPAPEDESLLRIQPKHKAAVANYLKIFRYATLLDKFVLALSALTAVGAGLTMPLMYIIFGSLVHTFTDFFKQGQEETEREFIHIVNEYVLYIVYVFAAKFVLSYISNLGFRMTSLRISAAIRLVYLQSLFNLPISTLDMLPSGQTASIITTVATNLQAGISEKLSQLFAALAALIGSLVIAFAADWLLALTTSMGLLFIVAVYALTTPRITAIYGNIMEVDIQASTVATEALGSVRMLAACGAQDKLVEQYARLVNEGRRRGRHMATLVGVQQGFVYFGIYATFALAFWAAFQMYMMMAISSPEPLVVVLLCIMSMAACVTQISTPLSAASQAADAIAIFHTIIDAAPQPSSSVISAYDEFIADGDLVLENVNFIYPTRPEVKVLEGLSLTFPAGKMTAIVGPSGSGKSTIVGIIERWYEFNGDPVANPLVLWLRNGSVSMSGRELRDIDVKQWRSQIGLVQQDNVLFTTTIHENVAYGLVGTRWEYADSATKERLIKHACKEAFADEFINRLPQGYHTPVGELGIQLSGGQRQRLAIARAIVKQPKILILDEATSAIDVRSEQIVQAALDRACKGRTTIVIAHRLGTIKKADNIIVLRQGRVVQRGTHESLMADVDGAYSLLAASQDINVGASDVDIFEDGDIATGRKIGDKASKGAHPEWLSQGTGKPRMGEPKRSEQDDFDDESFDVDEKEDVDSLDGEGRVRVIDQASSSNGSTLSLWTLLREQAPRWRMYPLVLIGALGAGASTPLQAYLFATLISLFTLWGTYLSTLVNFWCLMFAALALGVGLSQGALGWSTTTLGFGITRAYRKEYLSNLLHQSAAFFDAPAHASGALVGRLATDPMQLQQLVGVNLAFMLMSWLNLVGCVAISFVFGWKLTLVALATSLPVVVAAMFYRVRYEMRLEAMSNEVFAESARFACESIAAVRTVSSLTLEEGTCRRYGGLLRDHVKRAFRTASISVLLFAFSDSISLLCMAFILWYGGRLLSTYEYTPFQYMIVYIAVVQGGMSAGQWLSFGPNIASATAAADRILTTREDEYFQDGSAMPPEADEKGVEVEFKDVWFEYPSRAVPVLKGLDLKISRGQFAAIVGPSGSGKTTIISLLERFYALEQGEILYNGVDISTLDLAHYRRNLSLVAQEPGLFGGSIRHNIVLGLADDVDDATVRRAAQDAGIDEFIMSLPQGYATPVGAHGLLLSGGQKQRVSLARALIRRPALLLLDEATSSLDTKTERRVQAVLNATKGTRTMIVVAHRLATVRDADVILVMAEGAVVEQGNHESLLAERGVYYQMCQSQALDS